MSICKKLIDVAVDAGCNAVKFQKRDLEKVYTKEFLDSRESPWGTTQRAQKEGLEFNAEQYKDIDTYCKEKIEWYASAWDLNSQDFLNKFNCNYNKVASAMIVHLELLEKIASEKNIPLFQRVCLILLIYKKQLIYLNQLNVHLN